MNITIVAGTRPNFIKVASIMTAIHNVQRSGVEIDFRLVHTGQHYDHNMSDGFFEQLNIPPPAINLNCGGGTQAEQTAAIMIKFEQELIANRPDVVLVVGDVTSTMACALAAKKLCIDVVHVEAGIRSFDTSMPEEINRIVTDSICDHFFTTSVFANNNLIRQSVPPDRIHFVGNTMIDTLLASLDRIKQPAIWKQHGLKTGSYFLVTIHRPSNADDPAKLKTILTAIADGIDDFRVIFPVHPRTRKALDSIQINREKIIITEPISYLEFMYLIKNAKGIITDSGGITEEATILNVPCLTLRENTERPETVEQGTNELIGNDFRKLQKCLTDILAGRWKKGTVPSLWDGNSASRIISILTSIYNNQTFTAKASNDATFMPRVGEAK